MNYKKNHDLIVEVCNTALTFTEIEARLGTTTPNTTLRRYIKQNRIPLPCYEGQKASNRISKKPHKITEKDLCKNSQAATGSIKNLLLRTKKKKEQCEECGWCEKRSDGKIPIHLHHKNGDSSDNSLENLKILCPNCHSLTANYAGKNMLNPKRRKEARFRKLYYAAPKYPCQNCGKLGYGKNYCSTACSHESTRRVEWPTKEQLEKDIKATSWSEIGRKYGVSDNAIRKWAKHYNIKK